VTALLPSHDNFPRLGLRFHARLATGLGLFPVPQALFGARRKLADAGRVLAIAIEGDKDQRLVSQASQRAANPSWRVETVTLSGECKSTTISDATGAVARARTQPADAVGARWIRKIQSSSIQDTYGSHSVKLPAGDLVLYPSDSLRQVTPVTRGVRLAAFFRIQSLMPDRARRGISFELDAAIVQLSRELLNHAALVSLTFTYHTLLRHWAEV